MRLAQAARKLGITTEDIVSFLAKKEVNIIKDSNTKLDATSVDLLYSHYGKPKEEEIEKVTPAPIREEKIVEAESILEDKVTPQEEVNTSELEDKETINKQDSPTEISVQDKGSEEHVPTQADEELKTEVTNESTYLQPTAGRKYKTVSDLLEEQERATTKDSLEPSENSEEVVIKAAKVNLKGLNVLGKIELPEKPEKSEKKASDTEEKTSNIVRNKRFDKNKASKRGPRSRRELSPQEIRAREQRKAQNKRLAEEAKKKKQKESYYTEQILKPKQKAQKQQKAKKKSSKKEVVQQSKHAQPKPKTVLGKFWRWLNT